MIRRRQHSGVARESVRLRASNTSRQPWERTDRVLAREALFLGGGDYLAIDYQHVLLRALLDAGHVAQTHNSSGRRHRSCLAARTVLAGRITLRRRCLGDAGTSLEDDVCE